MAKCYYATRLYETKNKRLNGRLEIGNKQRLNHHIKAHEDGKWVREAAIAYAKKSNLKQKSA